MSDDPMVNESSGYIGRLRKILKKVKEWLAKQGLVEKRSVGNTDYYHVDSKG